MVRFALEDEETLRIAWTERRARAVQMTRSGVKGQVARCDHDFVIANPA